MYLIFCADKVLRQLASDDNDKIAHGGAFCAKHLPCPQRHGPRQSSQHLGLLHRQPIAKDAVLVLTQFLKDMADGVVQWFLAVGYAPGTATLDEIRGGDPPARREGLLARGRQLRQPRRQPPQEERLLLHPKPALLLSGHPAGVAKAGQLGVQFQSRPGPP